MHDCMLQVGVRRLCLCSVSIHIHEGGPQCISSEERSSVVSKMSEYLLACLLDVSYHTGAYKCGNRRETIVQCLALCKAERRPMLPTPFPCIMHRVLLLFNHHTLRP
jgi:hypothetical protein